MNLKYWNTGSVCGWTMNVGVSLKLRVNAKLCLIPSSWHCFSTLFTSDLQDFKLIVEVDQKPLFPWYTEENYPHFVSNETLEE